MFKQFAIASAVMFAGAANAGVIIDDFKTTSFVEPPVAGGTATIADNPATGVIGDRELSVTAPSSFGTSFFSFDGELTRNSFFDPVTAAVTWGGLNDLDADLSSAKFFRTTLIGQSIGTGLGFVSALIEVTSGLVTERVDFTINNGDDRIDIDFSKFGGVDFSDVDRIVLGLDTSTGSAADFAIGALIAETPLPGALPLMLGGMAVYAARRRRNAA